MARLTSTHEPTAEERKQIIALAEHILGGGLSFFLDTGQFASSVMRGGGCGPGRPTFEFDSRKVGVRRPDRTWAALTWATIRRDLCERLRPPATEQLTIFDAIGAAA